RGSVRLRVVLFSSVIVLSRPTDLLTSFVLFVRDVTAKGRKVGTSPAPRRYQRRRRRAQVAIRNGGTACSKNSGEISTQYVPSTHAHRARFAGEGDMQNETRSL